MMKATLFALFVALLMVGCGESSQPSEDVDMIFLAEMTPLEDTILDKVLDKWWIVAIIVALIVVKVVTTFRRTPPTLDPRQKRGLDRGRALIECYECKGKVDSEAKACPHCGLPIEVEIVYHDNGQMSRLTFLKDGKHDGLWTEWYENGQKKSEHNYKDDELMSAKGWKLNGEKCPETNVKDGNGVVVWYNEDGTEWFRETSKDGWPDNPEP